MSNPLLSVLIPVYNGAQFIHECLDSVFNQTYSNLEILISDDGSTDDSKGIIGSVERSAHKNFTIRGNRVGWRTVIFNPARSRVHIFYSPQDDLIPPKYLETLFKKFNKMITVLIAFPYVKA